LRNISYF